MENDQKEILEEELTLPEEETEDTEPAPEPHFVTKTALNAQIQLEATKYAASTFSKVLTWVCAGILVVILGFSIYQLAVTASKTYILYVVLLSLALIYMVYSHFFGQKRSLSKWTKQIQSSYGTDALHLTTEFYDLTFNQTVEETQSDVSCGYSSIEKIEETPNLFLLRSGKNRWYFVEKAGIQGHTPEEFNTFIREKCGG